MTLPDALTDALATLAGHCPLAGIRDQLPAGAQGALDAALTDPGVPSEAIAAALTAAGNRIAPADVRQHRGLDCPCIIPTEGTP